MCLSIILNCNKVRVNITILCNKVMVKNEKNCNKVKVKREKTPKPPFYGMLITYQPKKVCNVCLCSMDK
ncbi:hypothetical protein BWZ20_08420 [Winogradskyella sp. J14-2]|nr:hypothetical protein BWZ20_08420 [Winogradskyella sp. J14-2]